jgi:murein DD-endopeptidase MepM/ murein hydrolase activator NlpD
LFSFLLVLSVGLNIYFLVFQNSSDLLGNVHATEPEEAKEVKVPTAALEDEAAEPRLPTVAIREEEPILKDRPSEEQAFNVKRTSLDSSGHFPGRNIQTLRVRIKNSLSYTICRTMNADECGPFAAQLGRLLAWSLDVNRDLRKGDHLDVVYERLDNQGQFKILHLNYESGYLGKTLEANFYKATGMTYGSYFDREGKEIPQRIVGKQSPIAGYIEITSLPGDFRRGRRGHHGTDFKAEVGTPIRATFDGRVLRINWNVRANGYCVELDHPAQGIKTRYLHLSRVLVKRGQYVKQGEAIAQSGNTGRSFAPHLHYEVLSRGKKKTIYNPFDFKYHKTYRRKISNQETDDYLMIIRRYDTILQANEAAGKTQVS